MYTECADFINRIHIVYHSPEDTGNSSHPRLYRRGTPAKLEKWFRDAGILVRAEIAKNTAKAKMASGGKTNLQNEKPAETKLKKVWYKKVWVWITGTLLIFASIATILTFLFGDNIYGRFNTKPQSNNPVAQIVETQNALGNYKIESLTLKAINCLNDSKGDEFRIQLFAAGKEIENDQENVWHPITEGNSVAVDVNSFKFNENSKETFIAVRLSIKDKDKDNNDVIQIDNDKAKYIYLKENNIETLEFVKHYPKLRMTRYLLTYRVSQKRGS